MPAAIAQPPAVERTAQRVGAAAGLMRQPHADHVAAQPVRRQDRLRAFRIAAGQLVAQRAAYPAAPRRIRQHDDIPVDESMAGLHLQPEREVLAPAGIDARKLG